MMCVVTSAMFCKLWLRLRLWSVGTETYRSQSGSTVAQKRRFVATPIFSPGTAAESGRPRIARVALCRPLRNDRGAPPVVSQAQGFGAGLGWGKFSVDRCNCRKVRGCRIYQRHRVRRGTRAFAVAAGIWASPSRPGARCCGRRARDCRCVDTGQGRSFSGGRGLCAAPTARAILRNGRRSCGSTAPFCRTGARRPRFRTGPAFFDAALGRYNH